MTHPNSSKRSIFTSYLPAIGLALTTWIAAAASTSAGEMLFQCKGLEEKSHMTSIAVKMYQGYDGWFFREGDIENMYELSEHALSALVRVNAALRSQNIHLILMPMLPRGIAGASFIPNGGVFSDMFYDPAFSAQQFQAMVQSLREAGIDTVDINEVKDKNPDFDWNTYYLKRDIHWTTEGAKLVASALAQKIADVVGDIPDKTEFKTEKTGGVFPIRNIMGRALNEICQDKIPGESVAAYSTKRDVESLDALFADDTTSKRDLVHVVGTSFTDERMDFNFNGFLREALKHDVSGFSIAGGGLTQSFHSWTQSPSGLKNKPEILVWEYVDLQSTIRNADYVNDALVPAIVGDCEGERLVAEKKFDTADSVQFDLPQISGKPADHYLAYEFSNKALASFKLTYNYENSLTKNVSFQNPTRVSGLSKLYQALPDTTQSPQSVRLAIGEAAVSAGSVKLCRYPAGILQNHAISN